MLFVEILEKKYKDLEPVFDHLFVLALKNQTHSGDLLLVLENGYINDEPDPNNPAVTKTFYNIGDGLDYHCETACHDFIRHYIKSTVDMPYEDYKQLHVYTPERRKEIDGLTDEESMTIQLEMLIYLKIWEGENLLKKMYQLARLIDGQAFNWHLSIRFGKQGADGSMERFELLRYIKDSFEKHLPAMYDVFKHCHRSQLRNAIAHSQYAFIGRHITLNNHIEGKSGYEHGINFDDWVDIFHGSLTIFTLYEMLLFRIREHYYQETKPFKLKKEIRVTRLYPKPKTNFIVLHSREFFKDWSPYPGR